MSSPTSPHCPASSPSSSLFSASLPAWHFPFGPSSRYHLSERPRISHARVKTSYTPRAPVLSTEQRAHRRAQNSSTGGYSSPPLSEYSRSPLSRFSSYSSNGRATMANPNGAAPLTPAKMSRRNSSLQTSPFSDYFSDDARSSLNATSAPAPSTETKALLVRMNKLQSQLMRDQSDSSHEAIKIVGQKLAEIDVELNTLHSQTRLPTELDDSGVFMPAETTAVRTPQHSREPSSQSCRSLDSSVESSRIFDEDGATLKQYQAERTWYLSHMQELLEKLNSVQVELRQRHSEFAELHERHITVIEEKEELIEQLRSENEGLRQDLGFEYSELLFLKLQMKSMEVDIDDLRDDNGHPCTEMSSSKRNKKNRILSEMDRWRTDSDWQDVEARFKRRRSKYGISTSPIRKDSVSIVSEDSADEEATWQLETVREGRGRIQSLTIKRTDSSHGLSEGEGAKAEAEAIAQPVTFNGSTGSSSLQQNAAAIASWKQERAALPVTQYADHCTQTESLPPYPLEEEKSFPTGHEPEAEVEDEDEEVDESVADHEDDHDCAVTTSTSSEADADLYQDVEEEEETILEEPTLLSVPHKSAWQELWSSLQSLTGIPDDDDEDEY